jgi:hypothetical protein
MKVVARKKNYNGKSKREENHMLAPRRHSLCSLTSELINYKETTSTKKSTTRA